MTDRWKELRDLAGGLSDADVARLERRLVEHPGNTEVRLLLVDYYCRPTPHYDGFRERGEKASKHWLWFVEHQPWIHVVDLHGPFRLAWSFAEADYAEAIRLWRGAMKAHPMEVELFRNALSSWILARHDRAFFEEVVEGAQRCARTRPELHRIIADMCMLPSLVMGSPSCGFHGIAVEHYFLAFEVERDPKARMLLIWALREGAYRLGQHPVLDLLREADRAGKAWTQATTNGREEQAGAHERVAVDLVRRAAEVFRAGR